MSETTTTARVAQKARTIIFNNHLPLRTRQDVRELLLDHVYLDFGGHYFEFCACGREPGKYHCWYCFSPAYSDDSSHNEYLGLFSSYEDLLPLIARFDFDEQGKIIAWLGKEYDDGAPGEITIPEC